MKISEFVKVVTEIEGKKVQINIAQVLEILKIVNKLLDGRLYRLIKEI